MRRLFVPLLLLCAACAHPPAQQASASASPAATPAQSPRTGGGGLVVALEQRNTLRVIPFHGTPYSLDVGVKTQGAASDGRLGVITAPWSGDVVLLQGWPPRALVVHGLAQPHDAAILADGRVAVTEAGSTDVAIIDGTRVTKRIDVGGTPHNVTTLHGLLYVTIPNGREVVEVDPSAGVRTRIALGERPHACLAESDARLWCVTYDAPHVLLIEGGHVTRRVSIGVFPHHLFLRSTGFLLVSDPNAGVVWKLGATGTTVGRWNVSHVQELAEAGGVVYAVSQSGFIVGTDGSRVAADGSPHAIAVLSSPEAR